MREMTTAEVHEQLEALERAFTRQAEEHERRIRRLEGVIAAYERGMEPKD